MIGCNGKGRTCVHEAEALLGNTAVWAADCGDRIGELHAVIEQAR